MEIDPNHAMVLHWLTRDNNKSKPLLELSSMVKMDENDLQTIVSTMQEDGLVSLSNPEDIISEVVTLAPKGFELVRTLSSIGSKIERLDFAG